MPYIGRTLVLKMAEWTMQHSPFQRYPTCRAVWTIHEMPSATLRESTELTIRRICYFRWSLLPKSHSSRQALTANHRAEAPQAVSAHTSHELASAPQLWKRPRSIRVSHSGDPAFESFCILIRQLTAHYNRSCPDSALPRYQRNHRQATVFDARYDRHPD